MTADRPSPLLDLPLGDAADAGAAIDAVRALAESVALDDLTTGGLIAALTLLSDAGIGADPHPRLVADVDAGRLAVRVGPLALDAELAALVIRWAATQSDRIGADVEDDEARLRVVLDDDHAPAEPAPPSSAGHAAALGPSSVELAHAYLCSAVELHESTEQNRQLRAELKETNRGVLALHMELDEQAMRLRELNETLERRVQAGTAKAQQRAELLRAMSVQLAQAENRERKRLAQTLHDHVQQLLVAAKMQAELLGVQRGDDPSATANGLSRVVKLIQEAIDSTRSMTVELCPPVLHDAGLFAALQWLVDQFKDRHHLAIDLHRDEQEHEMDTDTRSLVFQAVRELLLNTVKHAGVSEATLRLTSTPGATEITVADRGRGFDASQQSHTANGFGLMSIRERLAVLGGRLAIDSAPGAGARFTLHIPAEPAEPTLPEPAPADSADHAGPPSGRPVERPAAPSVDRLIRVVIADDHDIVRQGLCAVIDARTDMQVIGQARNGQEAIRLAHEHRPDVVLMDINMPQLNGIAATRQLHEQLPELTVIGLTMHDAQEVIGQMRAAGARVCLTKDHAANEVCDAILDLVRPNLAANGNGNGGGV